MVRRSVWVAVSIVVASSALGVACGESESGSSDDGDDAGSAGDNATGGSSGESSGGTPAQGGSTAGRGGGATGGRGGGATGGRGGGATGGRGGGGNAGQGGSDGGTGGGGGDAGLAGTTNGGAGAGGSSTGGSAGENNCATDCVQGGFVCCGTECVNANNDVKNCGSCGRECEGAFPYCDGGTCGAPVCDPAVGCGPNTTCCNDECCDAGELCCTVPGGPDGPPRCVEPVNDTCPMGCPTCPCASPDTPIATPSGERPISELRPGDLVYSVNDRAIMAVPVKTVQKNPAIGHYVMRLRLASGRALEISGMHPTADGRTVGAVRTGTELDGVLVVSVEQIPYEHGHTYDILPDSDTGTYFAGGVRMGSTLFGVAQR